MRAYLHFIELYQHLQTQPFEYYDNQKTGKLMSRLTTDLFENKEQCCTSRYNTTQQV